MLKTQTPESRGLGGEWEDEERELTLIQLRAFAIECIDEIEMIEQVH